MLSEASLEGRDQMASLKQLDLKTEIIQVVCRGFIANLISSLRLLSTTRFCWISSPVGITRPSIRRFINMQIPRKRRRKPGKLSTRYSLRVSFSTKKLKNSWGLGEMICKEATWNRRKVAPRRGRQFQEDLAMTRGLLSKEHHPKRETC